MRDMMGPHGTRRAKPPGPARTTPREQHPADLMDQHFTTPGPNESRMADITSARTFTERVHAASTRRRAPAPERGPAGPHRPAHRPGPGRPDHGNPAAPTAGRRPDRADPPPRPRRAVPGHPPRADPVRSRRGRLNGIQGRLPRQCPGPGPEPAVQDRTDPQPPPPPTSTTPGRTPTTPSPPPPNEPTATTPPAPTPPSRCGVIYGRHETKSFLVSRGGRCSKS